LREEAESIVVAVSDCHEAIKKKVKDVRRTKLEMKFEFLTHEGNHFEAGQQYMLLTHSVLSLIFFLFFIPLLLRFLKEY
jgi:hypothetical protein